MERQPHQKADSLRSGMEVEAALTHAEPTGHTSELVKTLAHAVTSPGRDHDLTAFRNAYGDRSFLDMLPALVRHAIASQLPASEALTEELAHEVARVVLFDEHLRRALETWWHMGKNPSIERRPD